MLLFRSPVLMLERHTRGNADLGELNPALGGPRMKHRKQHEATGNRTRPRNSPPPVAPVSGHQLFKALSSGFDVIRCTRSSGPCGRTKCDHGTMCPGGDASPWAHQIVAALNTKFFLAPG